MQSQWERFADIWEINSAEELENKINSHLTAIRDRIELIVSDTQGLIASYKKRESVLQQELLRIKTKKQKSIPPKVDVKPSVTDPDSKIESKKSAPQPLAISVKEFCGLYGISSSQTYVEIAAGRLRATKCGRKTLILRKDANRWLAALPGMGEE